MIFATSSVAQTEQLARQLSLFAKVGMVIMLRGELGAGKSTFARAFIKALALGQDNFDVPSPTFSLMQTYGETRLPVAHVDLYQVIVPGADKRPEQRIITHRLMMPLAGLGEFAKMLNSVGAAIKQASDKAKKAN